jgi:3-oxoacyl-[acyl-carrier protein] reductase
MTSPSDPFQLAGQVALVTGATRGIGHAIAAQFSQAGAAVWVAGRDIEQARQIADGLEGGRAVQLDVCDAGSVKAAIMAIRKEFGRLDILVNNAGVMHPAMLATTIETDIDLMMDTNIKGAFLCAQLAARVMAGKKSGSIINLSSIVGRHGASGFAAYAATKAAVIGMTQSMAKELAPHNIRVNAIAPGFIETDLTAAIEGEAREKAMADIGMGRFGSAQEVARLAQFLGSPASCYVTGQTIGVDGAMRI